MPYDPTLILRACVKWRTKRLKRLPRHPMEPVIWYAAEAVHTWHPVMNKVVSHPAGPETKKAAAFNAQAQELAAIARPLMEHYTEVTGVPESYFSEYPELVRRDAAGDHGMLTGDRPGED